MVLMERFRGVDTVADLVPSTADADLSVEAIAGLADALATFITACPQHPDVGSAVWALGKLRDPRFIPLFERIMAADSGYEEFARDQAMVSLQDLGDETGST